MKTESELDRNWPELAGSIRDESLALAIGVFGPDGATYYANRGMRALLGGEAPNRPRIDYLINPRFSDLWKGTGEVFAGLLTAGDRLQAARTIKARAWRRKDRLLIAGEPDALELDRLNRELLRTNAEINALQRSLIGKNAQLEKTLADLRRTQAMLIHAEKMHALGQLVAGLAHEINNPLGFIIANCHSLQEQVEALCAGYEQLAALAARLGAADAVRQLETAHSIDYAREDLAELFPATFEGLNRIRRLVTDLRIFSRLHQAERNEVDLAESLRSTLALAGYQLKEKRIELVLELSNLPPVECYPAELNQVFMNLIVNAVQAMPEGGSLRIGGERKGEGWVSLRFTDTGHGIPQELITKIFDPFFTTKPIGSGTGLGLSIAHQIITEHHGGRIEVSSRPGEGTCFTLCFPERLPLPRDAAVPLTSGASR